MPNRNDLTGFLKKNQSRLPKTRKPYTPSKKDLKEVLVGVRGKASSEMKKARDVLDEATKARREFEKNCKELVKLRKAERLASLALEKARDEHRKEILDCITDLRLYGVTSDILDRIERLAKGDDEVYLG